MKPRAIQPLVLGEASRLLVEKTVAFAQAHRIGSSTLQAILDGDIDSPGNHPNYCCTIPMGYRCVYTVEEQPEGWCTHISISVANNPSPNIVAVNLLLQEFGFTCAIDPDQFKQQVPAFIGGWPDAVYNEALGDGRYAVNIIQFLKRC
jgi:hypothetical protein